MAKGKHIILVKSSFILLIFFIANIGNVRAEAWLPSEGTYNLSMGTSVIDSFSRKIRNKHNDVFLDCRNTIEKFYDDRWEIYNEAKERRQEAIDDIIKDPLAELSKEAKEKYIKEQIDSINAGPLFYNFEARKVEKISSDIKHMEEIARELSSFSEESSSYIQLEYGINSFSSIGGKIGYDVTKFTDLNSGNAHVGSGTEKIDIFYKYKIFGNESWIVTLRPKIQFPAEKGDQLLRYADISLLVGQAKLKNDRNTYLEAGVTIRKYFSNIIRGGTGIIISMQEGMELGKGFSISNYTEYEKAQIVNILYRRTLYDQISIEKEIAIDNSRLKRFTARVGYYWKTSLENKRYIISGPTFSLQFNL